MSIIAEGGDQGRTSVHVTGGGALQLTFEYAGRKIVTQIKSSGTSSCYATQKYFMQPGHKFFEGSRISNGEHVWSSDEHVENLTCTISAD